MRGPKYTHFDCLTTVKRAIFKIRRGAAGGGAHLSRGYESDVAGGGTVVGGGGLVAACVANNR